MFFVVPPADSYSTKLPARLEAGDEACFLFPTTTFGKDAKPLLARIRESRWRWFIIRRVRVGVYATTGERFMRAPDSSVRRFLAERAKAAAA